MRVLVTGADGFAGRHLVRRLVETGHEVIAGCRPGGAAVDWTALGAAVRPQPLEITATASIEAALDSAPDGIVHLAAVASVREASADPGAAWTINAAGAGRLVSAVADRREAGRGDPVLVLVSTAEVYGMGSGAPRLETDPLLPQSPYAASKVAAEVAALQGWRRSGVRAVIARPFPHTGRGQTRQYVLPAFVEQLRKARKTGATSVSTGNLERVRDFLDVRDVVEA
ncbi:MAG: NAD-dependent epimerase/dehydratase family protein, partial [Gemmatimonadales bacterium]